MILSKKEKIERIKFVINFMNWEERKNINKICNMFKNRPFWQQELVREYILGYTENEKQETPLWMK